MVLNPLFLLIFSHQVFIIEALALLMSPFEPSTTKLRVIGEFVKFYRIRFLGQIIQILPDKRLLIFENIILGIRKLRERRILRKRIHPEHISVTLFLSLHSLL